MKLDAWKLFLSTLGTFAIIWTACAALVLLLPVGMMWLTGHMAHMDFQSFTWSMSTSGFFVGLIAWSVLAAGVVWLIASLYNRLGDH